jgi:hypothetical protein
VFEYGCIRPCYCVFYVFEVVFCNVVLYLFFYLVVGLGVPQECVEVGDVFYSLMALVSVGE